MMINLLVDTNVLIYAMDNSSAYHPIASSILANPDHKLFITTKNISEFFAVTSKLKIEQKKCLDFYNDVKFNATTLFPTPSSLPLFEKLLHQYQPKGNIVYDLEIVSVMLDNGIDQIATFNQKDFINIAEVQILRLS